MSKLQALREKKKTLAASLRQQADKMNADGYTPTGEDQANWEKVNADYNAVMAAVEREERVSDVEGHVNGVREEDLRFGGANDPRRAGGDGATGDVDHLRTVALQAWCRSQMGKDLSEEHLAACRSARLNPRAKEIEFGILSTKSHRRLRGAWNRVHKDMAADSAGQFFATLSNQNPTSGGYLIPPLTMLSNLEINMLAYGGLLQVADTMTTTSGERMGWPTADDTSNKGVRLGPNSQAGPANGGNQQGTDPSFGQVYWDAHKYSSRPVLVPYELLEDAQADLPTVLGEMLGERLGRVLNDECTTGTGNSMPKGIVTAAGAGYTTKTANKLIADDLISLEHTVDPAYRSLDGVGYMMHDSILLAVRLLKDGDGKYLYATGTFGAPDKINNKPFTINQSMANSVATGNVIMLFGRLPAYKVRRVNGVRMYRLEERYRDTDQDGFIALLRADGNLLTAGTNPVQKLVVR